MRLSNMHTDLLHPVCCMAGGVLRHHELLLATRGPPGTGFEPRCGRGIVSPKFANSVECRTCSSGFLIRLANFVHLDNQSDSEKKAKRHSKARGEKRPNPGSFWFTAVGGRFFSARQDFRSGQFGLRMAQTVHTKTVCLR
jgi:hypothetical protein